jgi:membrane-bound serine protease (ClpP class)
VTSHGLLTVGGLIAFALGASALYTAPGNPTAPDVTVALPLIAGMTLVTGLVMGTIAIFAMRSRRMTPSPGLVGSDAPRAGTLGEVHRPLAPVGSVYAAGEEWTARSVGGLQIERGTPVRIVSLDGLVVVVEPVDEVAGDAGPAPSGDPAAAGSHT